MKVAFLGNVVPFTPTNSTKTKYSATKPSSNSFDFDSKFDNSRLSGFYSNMYFELAKTQGLPLDKKLQLVYEGCDNAEKLFRENLKNGKPLFDNVENVPDLLANDKVRRNLIAFLPKYAQEELDKLQVANANDPVQMEKIQSLEEVRDFFKEFKENWPIDKNKNTKHSTHIPQFQQVAFAGSMTNKDEKYCKNIVHAFATACAGVSVAMGEGAAVGADTPILRTLQLAMFSAMAAYLQVPLIPSAEYYTKEMFAGATLGVGGAKLLTSWLGIGGTVATGGTATPAITGAVRGINGSLSFLITEKMGRGYVNRVKNNQMTFKHQTVETLAYFAGRGVLTDQNPFELLDQVDFADTSSPELIKDALKKMPPGSSEALSAFLDVSKEFANCTGTYFAMGMAQNILFMEEKSPEKIKASLGPTFKNALLNAVIYEICDFTVGETITKEATEAVKEMQENLEQYPDVYRKIIELEHEFYEQINIEDLSKDAFVDQFKNKTFVYNFSNFSNHAVSEMTQAWRNRKNKIQAQQTQEIMHNIQNEETRNATIKKQVSSQDIRDIEAAKTELFKILEQQKQFIEVKDNFGYGRIGGYDNAKEKLAQEFVVPVSLEGTGHEMDIPGAILFYGPTGVGKTQLSRAVAEQAKCTIPRYVPSDDKNKLRAELEEKREIARENYENKRRRTVLVLDEFDDYSKDPELAKIFEDFIKTCSRDRITLMLTTNNPKDIPVSILNQAIKLPISPPDKQDATEVMKFYLNGKVNDSFDYSTVADALFKENQNGAYSNSQIKLLCEKAHKDSVRNGSTITVQNMLELIKKLPPEINNKAIEKFNSEIEEVNCENSKN